MTRLPSRLLEQGCRALVRLHPPQVRTRHGEEIHQTFVEVCAEARTRGHAAMVRTAVPELLDLLRSAVRTRTGWPRLPSGHEPRDARQSKGHMLMRSIGHDLLMGFRSLMGNKAHAALAVGVLAAGIGVNAAVFSIADSILFRPMPFADAARFANIWNRNASNTQFPGFSPRLLLEWRRQTDLFDRVEGYSGESFVLAGHETTEMIGAAKVTPGLLPMLGVQPLYGRLFLEGDGREGTDKRVIMSERLWRSHFGADPSLVGRTVRLNGTEFEVIGIMPASFYFPYEPQRLWAAYDPAQPAVSAGAPRLDTIGRLAPGVTKETAAAQIEARGIEVAKAAGGNGKTGARANFRSIDTRTSTSVWSLVGAVAFLLLIVCANLANLSLARALSRSRDFAVRSALGASRGRLIREALSESLLIGIAGSLAGLIVAKAVLALTLQVMPEAMTFSSLNRIDLDPRVLLFTAAAGLLSSMLFGMPPAIAASRPRIGEALKSETRASTGSRGSKMFRSALIVAEIALSVILLVGAALMTRSFVKLATLDKGFDPSNLIAMRVGFPADGYADAQSRYRFTADFIERVKALPGVTGVTAGGVPPDSNQLSFGQMEFEDRPGALTRELVIPYFSAWPGYFPAIGIPIREGRAFTADEEAGTIIVNEGFAAEFFAGQSAIGKRIRWEAGRWMTIVGVAGEVRQTGVGEETARHEFFMPMRKPVAPVAPPAGTAPVPPRGDAIVAYATFLARVDQPTLALPAMRAALRQADVRIALWDAELIEHKLAEEIARPRMILLLMSIFAVMALLLSAAGIYGVLSMTVVQRLREIGVRMALGAAPRSVGVLILRNALWLTGLGLAIGIASSYFVLRFIRTLLYEVEPFDPVSVAVVAAVLGLVSLAAAWRPARRAMKVDPVALLRSS
ncbi:MAG: ABC transporter permease [Acidobacteriota bacterium]|nr:ABC transporter permease [Acidobacteriota bacterium]